MASAWNKKKKAIKPEKYNENNIEQLSPTVCNCCVWPFCICKFLPLPKSISGAGPHSFYNLTALIFSKCLHSTIAYFQISSRALEVAWTKCSLFSDRETETYREHNLHMVPWELRKGHCLSLLKRLLSLEKSPVTIPTWDYRRVFCHKPENSSKQFLSSKEVQCLLVLGSGGLLLQTVRLHTTFIHSWMSSPFPVTPLFGFHFELQH